MPEPSAIDRLDLAIQALLESSAPPAAAGRDAEISPLLRVASALRGLPRAAFRARLASQLTPPRERKDAMTTTIDTERAAAVRQSVIPQLRVKNAAAAIDFYIRAFGARETMRFVGHGQVAHAELAIGDSMFALGEEAPDYGFPGPEALGGSPVGMHIYVIDVDAFVERAVAAGARLVSPPSDQFYGDRVGHVADPFGYRWAIATRKEELSVEEMYRRFESLQEEPSKPAESHIPEGFRAVTPYLIAQNASGLIDFTTRAFGATELSRDIGPAGGVHAHVRLGDSTLMIGGGAPELSWRGDARPGAFHVYVPDTDATFARAVEAGATPIDAPADREYGERSGAVKDAAGNSWYIATAKGAHYVASGVHVVNPYLHPLRAEPLIAFLKRAFEAREVEKHASPDGVVHHAKVRIGDAVIEMGEAHGPYQPTTPTFYLYVPDVDATYRRALDVGATPVSPPVDQPYGDRNAGVKDAFGNLWYLATPIKARR